MTRASFNQGWTMKPKVSIFAEASASSANPSPVTLPHDAMLTLERSAGNGAGAHSGYFPGGAVEYSKTFDVPESHRSKRLTVQFQGVYRDAMVFVNGDFAGQRPNGYSTFEVALDSFLKYGQENTIRVESRAHEDSRWYSGLGIHRDAVLVVAGLVHVPLNGVKITTPDITGARAVVEVATTVRNAGLETATVEVRTEILDGELIAADTAPVTVRSGDAVLVRQRLYVRKPKLWGVDSPQLYQASTRLEHATEVVDEHALAFGIRSLQLDPESGLQINGETIKLRGACIHHDNGILGAAAIGRAEERRIELLKAAGFNSIRSSHNPISQAMLDACDKHGMLVMDETFDIWTESKSAFDYSLSFPEWWERDVEAMVAKDYNHPSVIFYSIGNEIPETGSGLGAGWGRKLAEKIRSLDSTRYITNGINGFVSTLMDGPQGGSPEADAQGVNDMMNQAAEFMNRISASALVTERTAESHAVVDVAGLNYGESRYLLDRELFPNRIIVGTETYPGRIAENWKLVTENPHIIGDYTWTGWDYLGETGIGRVRYAGDLTFAAPYPWIAAWCGDIDITGHRRPASYYREIVFGLRSAPYIAVQRPERYAEESGIGQWAWSDSIASWSWSVPHGSPIKIEVYSDSEEVELLLNGRSVGRQPAGPGYSYRALFNLAYESGEITAVGYTRGTERSRSSLLSASGPIRLTATADRSAIRADDSDLCFVELEFQDAAGTLATSVEKVITVAVEGPGRLFALGSGRPSTTEDYTSESHTSFDGRVLAVIRPTGDGTITLTATAEGYDPVTLSVLAEA
ncbi:glycoside hydrolase family 2 TIM barrel-domain containing protein [Arthrobacter nitrophenolicus]|uniref:Glycoside hydrolase family 2 protein n=1 Tax=Arthrobacter nitrophenolicus TaxID=683150 RepID=A0A4R5Y5E0_9MICC|nr:glycoside hydrolase family 2 TIM barrel-domain containing protein [Arthrobacter nitrophenolicus]TDL39714.1 glycoside hydrolase family 2 protein [Arthrobacter nitrophenolicus]